VSWLRLERYHLGEVDADERRAVAEHLAACAVCAACLARIESDDASVLPPLAVPAPARGNVRPLRRAPWVAAVGALAAAAAAFLFARGRSVEPQRLAETRVKGGAVAFSLVREDGERIAGDSGVYRDGDRFKALVTCPPGESLAFDLVVTDAEGTSFPLEATGELSCANDVPMHGAFRLTGRSDETVCLAWSPDGPVDRTVLAAGGVADDRKLCKRLSAAPR
jgi:hypothetical protein